MSGSREDRDSRWLDEPKNVNWVFRALVGLCVVSIGIDLGLPREGHWAWEEFPGFYGAVGFVAFWCIVIAGKHLRKLLMRDEDYYDP